VFKENGPKGRTRLYLIDSLKGHTTDLEGEGVNGRSKELFETAGTFP
jgi:hypothetical protein